MVNGHEIFEDGKAVERAVAFSYAPMSVRPALKLMWSLDDRLGDIVGRARGPFLGEIRLAWWRDQLAGNEVAASEPILNAVRASSLNGQVLAEIAEGWSLALASMPLDCQTLEKYAVKRGESLFGEAARLLGEPRFAPLSDAGIGWALTDFADRCANVETGTLARSMAASMLIRGISAHWPKRLRPIGMLAHLALVDSTSVSPIRRGSPTRTFRMLHHRLTGR